jgi:putative transposase
MKSPPDPHYRHRFSAEIISHAVWLYHVFSLSLRDVELLLAERGVVVSYETVRRWCRKFGQSFANCLRCRRPRPGDKWYLDEVFIRIQGVQHYLWCAVDQDGVVLDILVQHRRTAWSSHCDPCNSLLVICAGPFPDTWCEPARSMANLLI